MSIMTKLSRFFSDEEKTINYAEEEETVSEATENVEEWIWVDGFKGTLLYLPILT